MDTLDTCIVDPGRTKKGDSTAQHSKSTEGPNSEVNSNNYANACDTLQGGFMESKGQYPDQQSEIAAAEAEPLVKDNGTSVDVEVQFNRNLHDEDEAISAQQKDNIADDYSHLLQDRGWAWMVCFGGFFSHIITGGFERSEGVLFLEFTNRFHQSAQLSAWPGAIVSTIRLVMGPVATALSNRTSARTVTMIGSIIFSFGVIISGFAPNLIYIFFSYGLIQGIGRGLIYGPGLIMVGLYFNRRRGFGVGLATAGVGVGTFVFPPLVEWLFQHYSFQGAFLILGGLALNTCIVGALFRPLSVHHKIVLGSRKLKMDEEAALYATPEENRDKKDTTDKSEGILSTTAKDAQPINLTTHSHTETHGCERRTSLKPRHRKKSRILNCVKSSFETCCPVEKQKKDAPKRKLIDWSLLKDPSFLFFCFSICLFTAAFKSAFTFLPALAVSKGIDKGESASLLSISGILDTIGRIMAGVVLDVECIRPLRPIVYNGVVFIIVVVSFTAPYVNTYVEFAVLFGLYGLLTGTYVSQKSVILVDILGEEKLSSSLGLMICFQGIGTFVGPPLSGLLKDIFGHFDEAFFLGGAAMLLAGILMIISNVYRICRHHGGIVRSD